MGKNKKPSYAATMVVCDRILKKFKSDSQTTESLRILNEMCLINGTKVLFDNTAQCNPVRICSMLGGLLEEDWTMFGSPIKEIDYGNIIRWWPSSIFTTEKDHIVRVEFPTFEIELHVQYDHTRVSSRFFEDININEEDQKEDPKDQEGETMSDVNERVYGNVSEANEAVETTVETKRKLKLPKKSWVKIGIAAAAVAAATTAVVILLKKKNSSEAGSEAGSEAAASE